MEEQGKKQQELFEVIAAEGLAKDSKIEKLEKALAKLEPTYKETRAQLEEVGSRKVRSLFELLSHLHHISAFPILSFVEHPSLP
jgi:uncharacterized membrane protein YqiK